MRAIVLAAIALFVALLVFLLCGILYVRYGLFKLVYHDIFGWHEPDETTVVETDSGNLYCRCRYCRRLMMRDGEGNWF